MTIIIRDAAPDEAALLSDLALRSKAYWGYSDEFMEACRQELTVLPSHIKNGRMHYSVAERQCNTVGFYAIERLSDSEFELAALFVEPMHIGSGVGRALINHAKNHAAALGGRVIIVQSDPNAEKFYRAAGGRLTGVQESRSIPGRLLPTLEILPEETRCRAVPASHLQAGRSSRKDL